MLSSISFMYLAAIIAIILVLIPTITISNGVDIFRSVDPTGAYYQHIIIYLRYFLSNIEVIPTF